MALDTFSASVLVSYCQRLIPVLHVHLSLIDALYSYKLTVIKNTLKNSRNGFTQEPFPRGFLTNSYPICFFSATPAAYSAQLDILELTEPKIRVYFEILSTL